MKIEFNGRETSLLDLVSCASSAAREFGPSWKCICGKWNRGKDLSCWDLGGCGRTRKQGDVSSK